MITAEEAAARKASSSPDASSTLICFCADSDRGIQATSISRLTQLTALE